MQPLFVCAALLTAHPGLDLAHDRTVLVKLTAAGVRVEYQLEAHVGTAVRLDVPKLVDDLTTLHTSKDYFEAYRDRMADLLASGLDAKFDGQPLSFHCAAKSYRLIKDFQGDYIHCDYVFTADWQLPPGQGYDFHLRDRNYEAEGDDGRLQLTLEVAPELQGVNLVRPDPALWQKAKIDFAPGDQDKLRTVAAVVTLPVGAKVAAAPEELKPQAPREDRLHLLTLLDSPAGLGFLMLMAALFGAAHALTPGHGKTLVAAYLIGERGTFWHALLLGLVVTVTHTGVVVVVAALLPLLFPHADPGRVQAVFGFVGGLLIAGLGFWLLWRRLAGQADHVHVGGGHHHHHHHHEVADAGPGWRGLVALGVTGGIVPCWDAVVLLGLAIATQRLWLGLPLLLAFSAGLAAVLIALGIAVVSLKGVAAGWWAESRVVKALPLVSAAIVTVIGLWLCRESLR